MRAIIIAVALALAACDTDPELAVAKAPECAPVVECWVMSGGFLCCSDQVDDAGEAVCLLTAERVEEICPGDEPLEQPEPAGD